MAKIPETIATKPAHKLTNGWIELIVTTALIIEIPADAPA